MKAMWSGMISFGLVNIPVGLSPATEDSDISLHFYHGEDEGNIKNQRICTKCGKIVAYKDLVRGYEYDKGRMIVIDDEDLKKAAVESSRAINIEEFVDPAEIDPLYYERAYYIAPEKKSYKAYALLRKAMLETGKVGLAKIALRQREHLAAVKATELGLILYMMRFTDEIRAEAAYPEQDAAVGDREMKMAQMLIESMVDKFDPSKYHDTYADELRAVIEAKISGREMAEPKAEAKEATEVIDLIASLKASIEKRQKAA